MFSLWSVEFKNSLKKKRTSLKLEISNPRPAAAKPENYILNAVSQSGNQVVFSLFLTLVLFTIP